MYQILREMYTLTIDTTPFVHYHVSYWRPSVARLQYRIFLRPMGAPTGDIMNLPKRKINRLVGFDYSTPNAYFLTLCTNGKNKILWTDPNAAVDCPKNVPLTVVGKIVDECIRNIPARYPALTVDHFVIMPNHVHLLLQIHSDNNGKPLPSPTISTVMNQMKGAASKQVGCSIWQKGFYDHVIRDEKDYQDAWNYIEGNPGKWSEDELH